MKKLLYISIIALGLLFINENVATAQARFGIRGGANFATVSANGLSADSRTGFVGGVYADIKFNGSSLSIQPEALYSQKGFENGDLTYKLDYIEIPVLAKYSISTSGTVSPHIIAGPYVAINTTAKVADGDDEADLENISSTDFGLTLGAGVGFGSFNIGARYSFGFSGVGDDSSNGNNQGLTLSSKLKNRSIAIVAGFEF